MGRTAAEVKALRLRLGLSQEGLARKLGISLQTVRRWEHAKPLSAMGEGLLDQLDKGGQP